MATRCLVRSLLRRGAVLQTATRALSTTSTARAGVELKDEAIYSDEHWEMRLSLRKLIEKEINPYVDEWEAAKQFPAHEVSRYQDGLIKNVVPKPP